MALSKIHTHTHIHTHRYWADSSATHELGADGKQGKGDSKTEGCFKGLEQLGPFCQPGKICWRTRSMASPCAQS